jgi:hypothetical protein
MHYHHLYADGTGESHWRTVEVTLTDRDFAPPAKSIEVSDPENAARLLYLRLRAGWDEPIHPTPTRQKLICTAGAVDVTASDGEVRRITMGNVWFMEDKTGKRHHTRVIGDADFECVIVQLE